MKNLISLGVFAFLLLTAQNLICQNKHLIYSGEIFTVSYRGTSKESPEAIYRHEKGTHNILIFDDNKSLFYREANAYEKTEKDSSLQQKLETYQFVLADRHKKSSKIVLATYDTTNDSVYFDSSSDKKWRKIKPMKEPKLTQDEKAFKSFLESEHKLNTGFIAPVINYNDNTRIINGYNCKNAIVIDNSRTYSVWFTEEMQYNWCFDDYRFLIPGTVILIEYEGNPYFEFLRIENLDYSKIAVKEKITDSIMKIW
jgi:GLPGLI family protein